MDLDDDGQSSSGWVAQTGRVSLGEGDAENGAMSQSDSKQLYDAVLGKSWDTGAQADEAGALPPPYTERSTFYLIPKSYLRDLSQHALDGGEGTPPSLDITPLVACTTPTELTALIPGHESEPQKQLFWRLRDGLQEDEDFIYVGSMGWEALVKAYNYPADSPQLPRLCLAGERIEIALQTYRLHVVSTEPSIPVPPAAPPAPITITAPSTTTYSELKTFVRALFADKISVGAPLRLWTLDTQESPSSLEIDAKDMPKLSAKMMSGNDKTLADGGFADGDDIVLEVSSSSSAGAVDWPLTADANGNATEKLQPLFGKPAFYSGNSAAGSSTSSLAAFNKPQTRSQSRTRSGHGLVGLNNLGNTCFMASATQCLSNTSVLADYFLCELSSGALKLISAGVYREELNPDNPLGMHGQVAEAFGETLEALWTSPAHSSFSPRRLKSTCSRFAPQFAGYGQHDTQEFLAFLLDGLHEDLNRIKKKPYIEKPDWKPGGGDRELAELGKECWEGYKKRNDSVIVDLFQGQLQSTLVCPECHKESITMDPFMYLTVPMPITQTRTFKCIYFPKDTDLAPVNVQLLVPANASFSTVKEKLGQLLQTNGNNIVGFDCWKGGIYAWWLDSDPNTEAKDHDVAIFHDVGVPVTATHKAVGTVPTDGSVTVPVYTFRPNDSPRSSFSRGDSAPSEGCLEPFFITLSKEEAMDPAAVREAVMRGYSRLVKPEQRNALFVKPNAPQAQPLPDVDDEDDEVAEIRVDEEDAEGIDPTMLAPPSVEGIPRSTSSLSIASQSGRVVARGDLFKIYVADAASAESNSSGMSFFKKQDPNVHNLYRGNPSGAQGSWSSLEKRARAKRPVLQRMASSFSNLVGTSNSAAGSAANSDDEAEAEDSKQPKQPAACVRPGEALFVQWKNSKFEEFFEPRREQLLRGLELVVDPAIAKDAEKKGRGRAITLDDCLDEFSKEETLGQDDLWYCPVCKKHQPATKKLEIYKAPDILVICIKRFGSARTLRDKLDHMVSFPNEGLDLDERIGERRITQSLHLTPEEAKHYGIEHSTEPFIYDLYAVDNHFGGLGGGHYTAFCRNKDDHQWYNYDDSRVSKASAEGVQSRAAYLLFYKRRTERPIGGISRIKAEEASRHVTPMPSEPASPVLGPSVPASAMASSFPSMPGTPLQPSPTVSPQGSDDSDDDVPLGRSRAAPATVSDLTAAGAQVGFGNTMWGAAAVPPPTAHGFGLPTPDASDSEAPETSNGEQGLGGSYHVVRSDGTSESAEMVSAPSPPSE